jgi:glycosyltransferase involved in cell wall biosynthesis
MSGPPRISVIIPHYRDLNGLAVCLASLERQTLDRNGFEIVVADNNSPEGEAEVARVIAGRGKLVIVTEKGAGPARNGAVAASTGDILAFIDSDCVADPEWLDQGVKALAKSDFVGGHVKVLVEDEARMTGPEAFERVFAFDFKTYIEKKKFTGSGNLFCPRRVFDTVGGFRVGLSEDLEWSRRAQSCGFTLSYAPKAVVGHPARRTWEELTRKWKRMNEESLGLAGTDKAQRLKWLMKLFVLPISSLVHIAKVFTSPNLDRMDQRLKAVWTLQRIRWWRMGHGLVLFSGK